MEKSRQPPSITQCSPNRQVAKKGRGELARITPADPVLRRGSLPALSPSLVPCGPHYVVHSAAASSIGVAERICSSPRLSRSPRSEQPTDARMANWRDSSSAVFRWLQPDSRSPGRGHRAARVPADRSARQALLELHRAVSPHHAIKELAIAVVGSFAHKHLMNPRGHVRTERRACATWRCGWTRTRVDPRRQTPAQRE